jgi:hypothetical protein
MRKFFLVIFLLSSYLVAQSQDQQKHEKKRHIDSSGRLYVNKHLPVFLFFGNNANGSDLQKLKSESTPQFSNPFYFDTEGYNTIRTPSQVDTVTKKVVLPIKDIIFEVYADGLPPQTRIKLNSPNRYVSNDTLFFGNDLKVSIQSSDAVSGVDATYYSLNKNPWEKYSDILSIEKEGNNTIMYYSVDNVGNVEALLGSSFVQDTTPPEISYTINGVQKGNVLSPTAKIELHSTDNLSGVKAIYYQINDKTYPYTQPIPINSLNDGSQKISFYSIDNVNNSNLNNNFNNNSSNIEGKLFFDFKLDKTPPVSTIDVLGDQFKGKHHFVSPRTKFKLKATDETGLLQIRYGINKAPNDIYTSEFELIDKTGLQTIYYLAEDEVGNVEQAKSKIVFYDKTPPITRIKFHDPQFFNRDTLFINKNTEIELIALDSESGVLKTEYSINGEGFVEYIDRIKIEEKGFHKIEFISTDQVNNNEIVKKSQFVIDNNAPEIFINFSILKIADRTHMGETYPVYPSYTRMYIGATDKYSGTESIFYSIDNGPMQNYSTVVRNVSEANLFTQNKFYTIKVIAKDKLGNENTKTVSFFIEDKPNQ